MIKAKLLITALLFSGLSSPAYSAEARNLMHPDWHPDGDILLAEGSCAGSIDLYTVDLASVAVTRLLDMGATEGYPRWFPDGQRIAFHQMSEDRASAKIYVTDLEEHDALTNIERVSIGPFDVSPSPSADGKWLAYSATQKDGKAIAFVSFDDTENIPSFQNGAHVDFPTWIPGEKSVVFHSNISGTAQLYRLDILTREVRQLTTAPGPNFTGEISPDGTRLVYASQRDGDREIYVLDLGSGEDTRLTTREGRDGYPKFSPDGTKIAFHSWQADPVGVVISVLDLKTEELKTFQCPAIN